MEMQCTFRGITCWNMQQFIFAALAMKCSISTVQNTSDAKEPELQHKPRPLNECQLPGCYTTCGAFESGVEPHVFDLDQLFADMIALQRDGRNSVLGL